MLESRDGNRGGRQRGTCTTEVQSGGWGYGTGEFKVWWKEMGCEPSGNKKSGGQETRETPTLKEKKKRPKKEKNPILKKKKKKGTLVIAGLDRTTFLKGPEGCPLDHIRVPNVLSTIVCTGVGWKCLVPTYIVTVLQGHTHAYA